MRPRWTTARAVSGGADFRSSCASPTFSPVKERTGRDARAERMVRAAAERGRTESGSGLRGTRVVGTKMEEEEKERAAGVMAANIGILAGEVEQSRSERRRGGESAE